MWPLITALVAVLAAGAGYGLRAWMSAAKLSRAELDAQQLLKDAGKEAENLRKELPHATNMMVLVGGIAAPGTCRDIVRAKQAALLLVYGALPPAVINYVFAERYHQEPDKVAAIVLVGNLAAVVTLPFVLSIVL